MSIPDVTHFLNLISAILPENIWCVGGAFAIDLWCGILNIPLSETMPNNIDILYARMTPITPASFGSYKRKQTSPHTSVTYENPGFTSINLTMSRNNIKYYEFEGIKLLSPVSLLSWYSDEPELYKDKIDILKEIISRTTELKFKYIYSREYIQYSQENPAKRRLINTLI